MNDIKSNFFKIMALNGTHSDEGLTYYLETFGCQMNEYDSALIEGLLQNNGFSASRSKESADFLLINTCSVREHAENRVLSNLAQYRKYKEAKPTLKIALLGCMASQYREELLRRFPHLDYVVGPEGYRELPELLSYDAGNRRLWMGKNAEEEYSDLRTIPGSRSGYIAITRGCDNHCSYCIVPMVRGRERSRSFDSILAEAKFLAWGGTKEITLLGQNVNSYSYGDKRFADIIRAVNKIEGIERIFFLTSHPKDLTEDILSTIAECEKAAPFLHLPLQSGSNRILRLMNRKYSVRQYLDIIEKARHYIPGIALTTDIIVGFPGETEADFRETISLVEEVRFDDAFTYRYSPRPGTAAARMKDDVAEEVKLDRLDQLIRKVRAIAAQKLQLTVGSEYTIIVEKESKKDRDWWMGKTEHNRPAVIPKNGFNPGDCVSVKVKSVSGFTLRCRAV